MSKNNIRGCRAMEACPVCGLQQPLEIIVEHVNQCLNEIDSAPPKDLPQPSWMEVEYKDHELEERRIQEEENER